MVATRRAPSRGRRSSNAASPAPAKRASAATTLPVWAADDSSKQWAEAFFLAYSPFWIVWALCIVVPFKLYEVSGRVCCGRWVFARSVVSTTLSNN